ncbi:MAG: preprotein translocase subunit Sec61beta [Nanoarchaeota archaeon]
MARNNKISMPNSGAGLTRYFDEYKSNIQLKPMHVIILIILVIFVVSFLNIYGNVWFGG